VPPAPIQEVDDDKIYRSDKKQISSIIDLHVGNNYNYCCTYYTSSNPNSCCTYYTCNNPNYCCTYYILSKKKKRNM